MTDTKFPTLLEAIERVVELSKDSKMSDDFLLAASPEIGLLADSYGITEQQAVLFCICMERGPRRVDYDDFARHLDMSNIRVLSYASDIDALVHRRLLRYPDRAECRRNGRSLGLLSRIPSPAPGDRLRKGRFCRRHGRKASRL